MFVYSTQSSRDRRANPGMRTSGHDTKPSIITLLPSILSGYCDTHVTNGIWRVLSNTFKATYQVLSHYKIPLFESYV